MKKTVYGLMIILIVIIGLSCSLPEQKTEECCSSSCCQEDEYVFQYSLLAALNDKIYVGDFPVKKLKEHGDLGLGTFNYLSGEMVVLDGTVYKVLPEGKIVEADNEEMTPFAVVTKFNVDKSVTLNDVPDFATLREKLEENLISDNLFYALKIKGEFEKVKCGGVPKQTRPFKKRLMDLLSPPNRPIYETENISGTLIGIWSPAYMIDINMPGPHLHFIADDKSIGGHCIEVSIKKAEAGIDIIRGYQIKLAETEEFDKVKLLINDPESNY